jgi:CSLREA domain-containing protein
MNSDKNITASFVRTPQPGPNFVVTTADDHDDGLAGVTDCTLREAINAANANPDASTITFAANVRGVIALQLGQMTINQNTTIIGPGARALAISGNNSSRVFNILGGTVLISDLTITNGHVTGLVGSPGQSGGGMGGVGGNAFGGGIYNQAGLTLSNCWVVANMAQGGTGGIGGVDDANFPAGAGGSGGLGTGGGIYNNFNSLTLIDCTLSGNSTVGGLGGSGSDAFDNFPDDTGGNGGSGGPGTGGGVCNNGVLNVTNCTFSGNSGAGGAGGSGGNGYGDGPGAPGGPGGTGTGGGLANLNNLHLVSSTLSLNSLSAGSGGPGGTGRPGTAPSGPTGTAQGGGLQSTTTANTIQNSLIAGNTSPTAPDCSGTCTSHGYNLLGIDNGATGFTSTGDQAGTSGSALNPALAPLQFRGGPVPTMPLLPGSPAIDKGNSAGLLTDERSRPRPFDFLSVANALGGGRQ